MPKIETGRRLEILLQLRRHRESYGLEIVRRSGGMIPVGTAYVVLGRLEEDGLVDSRPATGNENPRLKIYSLSDRGGRVLAGSLAAVEAFAEAVA